MNLIVRNLPDDVHRQLKIAALMERKTLQKLVAEILTAYATARGGKGGKS